MNLQLVWQRVEKTPTDCWLWLGNKGHDGYGLITLNGKLFRAHRVAFQAATGIEPGELHVLHTCDVRSCINPKHLWLGTNQDNVDDKVRKNRQSKGEKHSQALAHIKFNRKGVNNARAKLTDDAVKEIRGTYKSRTISRKAFAEKYGVSISTLKGVLSNKIWTHVS